MLLSVICPVFNEEKYIGAILEFFIKAQPESKELFVVDGGSADKTLEIVEEYARRYPFINLLHNPDKVVPYALNLAIKQCKGDIIVRLDAHSVYKEDYFIQIINTFNKVSADIVGGPMRAIGNGPFQKAVAHITSTRFGVGNSNFHFEDYEGYTDSVYLGAWKRSIFKKTGLFDERLTRNQDDEFHYRAKAMGFKIYQNPQIVVHYFPRDTPKKLFSQYFQYGLYKPMVLKKIKSGIKLRHVIPMMFFLYIITLPLTIVHISWLLPLILYLILAFFSTLGLSGLGLKFNGVVAFFLIHLSYGAGFMRGLFKQ